MQGRELHWDGVRGLAAIAVVLSHNEVFFSSIASGRVDQGSATSIAYNFVANGRLAVAIFFVLSGVVLVRARDDINSLAAAAVKRYVRLTPTIAASTLLATALAWTIGYHNVAAGKVVSGEAWLSHLYAGPFTLGGALFQGFIGAYGPDHSYNGVLWTMRIELVGSLVLFGFAALFCRHPRYPALCLAAAAACTILLGDMGLYVGLFLIGSAIARGKNQVPIPPAPPEFRRIDLTLR